jgi:hypothetical protein
MRIQIARISPPSLLLVFYFFLFYAVGEKFFIYFRIKWSAQFNQSMAKTIIIIGPDVLLAARKKKLFMVLFDPFFVYGILIITIIIGLKKVIFHTCN